MNAPFCWKEEKSTGGCNTELPTSSERQKKKEGLRKRLVQIDREGGSQKLGDSGAERLARHMREQGKDCPVACKYFAVSPL